MNKKTTYRPKQSYYPGATKGRTKYYYTATGQKLMTKVATNPTTRTAIDPSRTRVYMGSMVLKGGEIEFIGTPEGRALTLASIHKDPDGSISLPNYINAQSQQYRYEYSLKDHLGNLRVSCRCGDPVRKTNGDIAKNNQSREPIHIVQQNDYDAWGLDFGAPSPLERAGGEVNRYQYNSKERIQDLGIELYEYGFRWYDPQFGRFIHVDPLADHPNQIGMSPYSAFWNNPIKYNDPDGRCPDCPDETYVPIANHVYEAKVGAKTSNGWEVMRVDNKDNEYGDGNYGALYKGTFNGKTEYIYTTAGTDFTSVEDWKDNGQQIISGNSP